MDETLAYWVYAVAGLVAIAVYAGLPRHIEQRRGGLLFVITAVAVGGVALLVGRLLGDTAETVYFCVLSSLTVLAAVRVVTHPRPIFSALYFLFVVLSTAALIILCGAEFLAAALVMVYAGAILVTYLFVLMMAQQPMAGGRGLFSVVEDYDVKAREPVAAVLAGFLLIATVGGVIAMRDWSSPVTPVASGALDAEKVVADGEGEPAGNTLLLGRALLLEDGFPVSLQVAGVLLLVAMIGAIALARKQLPRTKKSTPSLPPGEIGKRVEPF